MGKEFIKKRGRLILLFLLTCTVFVYSWRRPVPHRISSDYGPRILRGNYDWHEGIDYASPVGTEVYPVEDGRITEIGYTGERGYYVEIEGTQEFRYCHLAERYPATGYPCVEIEIHRGYYCIVFRNAQGAPTRAYSQEEGILIPNSTIRTTNRVRENTSFARSGRTGHVTGPHLHITANDGDDNPLLWVPHDASSYRLTFLHPADGDDGNQDNRIIVSRSLPLTQQLTVRVNTERGLDLNIVEFYLDSEDAAHRLRRFCYGGRQDDGGQSNIRESTTTQGRRTNGISPQRNGDLF